MSPKLKALTIIILLIIGGVVGCLLYKNIDPATSLYAPKCISYSLFNFICPGCGMQRAIHAILNGEILKAIYFNPLIVLSIPYILTLLVMDVFKLKCKLPKLYAILYGRKSIYVLLIILIVYVVLRNMYFES